MPASESSDKTAAVWPPAITLPIPVPPDPRLRKTARLAKASLWAAGAGILFWACVSAALIQTIAFGTIWFGDNIESTLTNTAYALGFVCELSGMVFGFASSKTKRGRLGTWLSIGLLCSGIVLTFIIHHTAGNWIWDALRQFDDSNCGC